MDNHQEGYVKVCGLIGSEALDLILAEWLKWVDAVSGTTVLHLIVIVGSVNLLERALKTVLVNQLNHPDYGNRTPLYYAVEERNLKKARILLKAGAKITCFRERRGVGYSRILCPFALTIDDGNLDMAILLLTTQGRPFPDGHDCNCCQSTTWPKRNHLERCKQELVKRKKAAIEAFVPFLFRLKRKTLETSNKVIYKEILAPMLHNLWDKHKFDSCWNK